jgi:hypothetical protein
MNLVKGLAIYALTRWRIFVRVPRHQTGPADERR